MKYNLLKITLLIGAMILIALAVSFLFPSPAPPAPKPLPNPNGYDMFVKAGTIIASDVRDYRRMDREALQGLLDGSTNALQLLRTGLTQECAVPLQNYEPLAPGRSWGNDLIGFRRLGQLLEAEGRIAEMEDRPGDAAKSYLDAIRLGAKLPHGGIIIHAMIGTAIESLGANDLKHLTSLLDANSCREITRALEELGSRREPWRDISEREREWLRQLSPGLRGRIAMLVMSHSTAPVTKKAVDRYMEQTAETRRLIIKLAAQAYELEKHQKAKSFVDLVPEYLKAIPEDPWTGTPMALTP